MLRSNLTALAAAVACAALAACSPAASPTTNAPQTPAKPAATNAPATSTDAPATSHATGGPHFKNDDGTTFTIADVPGKAKVFNFWATWCAPCIGEMPVLNDLSKKYASKDVTFVAVSVDENGPTDVKPFLERGRAKIGFRVAYATFDELESINVAAPIPDTLVFDAQGRLVKHFDKIIEAPELEAAIAEALANGAK